MLAFDKGVVTEALSELQGAFGVEYLEKIVQMPFDLPQPDALSLRKLLFELINEVFAGTPDELFDQTYFGNVY